MTNRLRIAVVGCGDVAYRHYVPALEALNERVQTVAVADVHIEAAERVAKRAASWSPGCRAFSDVGEMLGSVELDGAFNLTPGPLHGRINRQVLEKGVACYSEKPLASTVTEADELIDLAKQQARLFLCAPGSAVTARVRWLKQLAQDGPYGRPTLAVAHHADPGPADWLEYTGDPTPFCQQGVGPVFDHGIYRLHEMTSVLGPIARVQALGAIALPERTVRGGPLTGQKIKVNTQDHVLIHLEFVSGALGQLLASFATADTLAPWLELHLERGVVSFSGKSWESDIPVNVFDATTGAEGGSWQLADDVPRDEMGVVEAGATHFINCLLGQDQPVLTAEHARHVLEVVLGAYASIESGCAVEIKTRY